MEKLQEIHQNFLHKYWFKTDYYSALWLMIGHEFEHISRLSPIENCGQKPLKLTFNY